MYKIPFSKSLLPDIDDISFFLKEMLINNQLTNNGPQVKQLKGKLINFLKLQNAALTCNGTMALLIALKALNLKGEIITTPFTFSATANSLYWNNLTPVFCDIQEKDFNINVDLIESLITERTEAILAVHTFGYPCDLKKIKALGKKYHLKVIYDAAHCFNITIDNQSILNYGDISISSFHATKVFHTLEGGIVCSQKKSLIKTIDQLINFGFLANGDIKIPGLNAKMNEVQAAIGLLNLRQVILEIEARKKIANLYRELLKDLTAIILPSIPDTFNHNYSYFVIRIPKYRDQVYKYLEDQGVQTRKYFYPLLSQMSCYKHYSSIRLPIAETITKEVLALPIYSSLTLKELIKICSLIKKILE